MLQALGLRSATLLKKRLCYRCFRVNFAKFLGTTFNIEHFWWLLLDRVLNKPLFHSTETALHRCSYKKFFSKYVANLQKNTYAEVCLFIETTLWHECSSVNLLHIFRTPFHKNTYGRLLLILVFCFKTTVRYDSTL